MWWEGGFSNSYILIAKGVGISKVFYMKMDTTLALLYCPKPYCKFSFSSFLPQHCLIRINVNVLLYSQYT